MNKNTFASCTYSFNDLEIEDFPIQIHITFPASNNQTASGRRLH